MELYIPNNNLENLKEINILMEWPKLIILDISGNPFCQDPSYRIFTLFLFFWLYLFNLLFRR